MNDNKLKLIRLEFIMNEFWSYKIGVKIIYFEVSLNILSKKYNSYTRKTYATATARQSLTFTNFPVQTLSKTQKY